MERYDGLGTCALDAEEWQEDAGLDIFDLEDLPRTTRSPKRISGRGFYSYGRVYSNYLNEYHNIYTTYHKDYAYVFSTNEYAVVKPGDASLLDGRKVTEEDIRAVVCMYADIDIKGAAHKQTALPESVEDATSFLDSLPMRPSYVIDSGNGIHAIWLLEEPFVIRSSDDLSRIKAVSTGFGAFLIREGQKKGWMLDNVQDIARMLRAPGTLNFKTDPPKPCRIISHNPVRYPLSVFEEYKVENADTEPVAVGDDAIGSAERMRGKCAFIDYTVDEAAVLPEPW